jgi:hypothetical protein
MSDMAGFAIRLPETAARDRSLVESIDLDAVHTFWLGRRMWTTCLGLAVQSALLLGAGVFLLTQISSTPNLVVQIALTGSLLSIGGLAMLAHAASVFLTRLTIDRSGLRARVGWSTFATPWSNVVRWSVTTRRRSIKELPGIRWWVEGSDGPVTIPDGYLDERSRPRILRLFVELAPGKEDALSK